MDDALMDDALYFTSYVSKWGFVELYQARAKSAAEFTRKLIAAGRVERFLALRKNGAHSIPVEPYNKRLRQK